MHAHSSLLAIDSLLIFETEKFYRVWVKFLLLFFPKELIFKKRFANIKDFKRICSRLRTCEKRMWLQVGQNIIPGIRAAEKAGETRGGYVASNPFAPLTPALPSGRAELLWASVFSFAERTTSLEYSDDFQGHVRSVGAFQPWISTWICWNMAGCHAFMHAIFLLYFCAFCRNGSRWRILPTHTFKSSKAIWIQL